MPSSIVLESLPGYAEIEKNLLGKLSAALDLPASQQPHWPDPAHVQSVRQFLSTLPPLAHPPETDRLRQHLAEVAQGRMLLLQGGDCAETFATSTGPHVRANVTTLHRMSAVLRGGTGLPVVGVGRIAGQYAKPRSAALDVLGLPAYRGDIVNSATPTPQERTPDPGRMVQAYFHARSTLETVRAVSAHPDEIYSSHEALLLTYEQALTRVVTTAGQPRLYGGSAHFLWIGERTRQLDGAHVAVAELLANPIGIKLGPGTTPAQAVEYVERLDRAGEPGRLTLITRMGRGRVRDLLPPIVERVTASGHQVVWQCDPMHGNTRTSANGYKTRHFDDIADEVAGFVEVHRALGTHPGGLHLEFTGDPVTECLGGSDGIGEHELAGCYETTCDPRLNARQSVELVRHSAELFAAGPGHRNTDVTA
ncbi:3-deoxy-7-phosphoheptulonate synthase [Micromonospora cathayae]|uniref:Phospho-2-dehydro-3-deoxyheptonate aldolase n=1 Tax=Micromonospora cathayae TaxID=3028804 RepID=A0ABY7ZU53_9ACTN|nr:3-deoxy-7-phosphoheptulonate synthase class II [Micromonospora sp. HUAS 3]WDZ86552.1 3-deoxy-7-phosphoheptulonate synthase class II [Micromonospora sp. HUAS 3]